MYKNKAIIFSALILLVGVYVVITVMTVFSNDNASRYGDVSAPSNTAEVLTPTPTATKESEESEAKDVAEVNEPDPVVAAEVIEESVEDVVEVVETETSDLSESVTEGVEDVQAAVVDTVAVQEIVEPTAPASQPTSDGGAVHEVTAQGLVYAPLVITINPGDIVAWKNMASHDTQSMEGLIPEGAEHWHSAMGENYQRTFHVEGIYVYKCTPHFGAGMGGAIIVGQPTNLEAIQAADTKGAAKRLVKKAIAAAAEL